MNFDQQAALFLPVAAGRKPPKPASKLRCAVAVTHMAGHVAAHRDGAIHSAIWHSTIWQ